MPALRHFACPAIYLAVVLACGSLLYADDQAQDPAQPAAAELSEQEQAFADMMEGSVLVGRFSIDGKEDEAAKTDRYTIQGVSKLEDDNWVVHARIVYGQNDIVLPVPVKMHWAAETPVLSVTDLTIPLLGEEFSARLLFHDGRYAGTWGHGKVGGHMWGRIEKQEPAAE